MKISIEELDRQAAAVIAKKNELTGKEAELVKQVEELKATAQAQAEGGQLDSFKTTDKARQDAEAELYVTRAQLAKLAKNNPVTAEDAATAWGEYAGKYNKNLAKMLSDYETRRAELLNAYKAMLDAQAEACAVRERLAGYIGIKPAEINLYDSPAERAFPCATIPCRSGIDKNGLASTMGIGLKDPDAVFYFCHYAINNKLTGIDTANSKEAARINAVLGMRKTHL